MKKLKYFFLFILIVFFVKADEGPLQYPEPAGGWEDGDCQSTQIQSPIDIPSTFDSLLVIDDGSHAIIQSMNYSTINDGYVKFDGGHKWTTEELNNGYLNIILNGTSYTYKLHSIHFHLYSEHRLQNKQYPMEMHMVHKNVNKADSDNTNLVIGVLFDYKNNKENQFLSDMKLSKEKKISGASIKQLINEKEPFYYYKGGLTTIPCTENVNWIVFKDIHDMSFQQFTDMKSWIMNSNLNYYGTGYGNARGPKGLSNRNIYLENYGQKGKINKLNYLFIILPLATFLLYPIFILNYHKWIKNQVHI